MKHGSILQETETGSLRSVRMTLSQTRAAQRSHFSIFRRNATHLENSSCTGSRLDYSNYEIVTLDPAIACSSPLSMDLKRGIVSTKLGATPSCS
jgi:hypothetical protein